MQTTAASSTNAHRLVAVVVTYNRLSDLKRTLARLLDAAPDHLARVVVVDNACTDGTTEWLATQDDVRLELVRSPDNIGGAGGFELGMRHAVARYDPDWLVLMDDDARPAPDALARFHATDRSGADAWAAAVYHPDGRICDMNRPSLNPFWHRDVLRRTVAGGGRDAFHLGPEAFESEQCRPVDGTSFVGFFVSRAGIARVGYPDGNLFIYGEDTLFALQLRAAGGHILFDPGLCFEHDFTTSAEANRQMRPLWKCYYIYRNLLIVYRFCSGPWFVLVAPVVGLKWLSNVRHYSGVRWRFAGLVLRALRDGILRRTDVSLETVRRWAE